MVRTPRLRSTGSSSVPLMGERPCMRGRTRSDSATPIPGTISACGRPGSAARSTATSSRALEVEAGGEGVAARVVEAERAGAEDLHHERAGRQRAPEDEALGEIQPHVLHLAGDRVRERRELDLERARDAEGT